MGKDPCTLLMQVMVSPYVLEKVMVDLQGSDVAAKITAMKLAIMLLLNGCTLLHFLATLAHYVLPCKDTIIEKLFFVYLEIVDKLSAWVAFLSMVWVVI